MEWVYIFVSPYPSPFLGSMQKLYPSSQDFTALVPNSKSSCLLFLSLCHLSWQTQPLMSQSMSYLLP